MRKGRGKREVEGEKRRIKEKGEGKGEEYDMEREGREEKQTSEF